MKRHITYAAALAALLLVGAGCAAKQQTAAGLEAQTPGSSQATGKMEAKVSVNAEGTVDGTVNAILNDSEDEKAAQKDRESDASNLNADDGELNAYSDTSYDIK